MATNHDKHDKPKPRVKPVSEAPSRRPPEHRTADGVVITVGMEVWEFLAPGLIHTLPFSTNVVRILRKRVLTGLGQRVPDKLYSSKRAAITAYQQKLREAIKWLEGHADTASRTGRKSIVPAAKREYGMAHRGCGGEVTPRYDLPQYEYERSDGVVTKHPKLVCNKCDKEIVGDDEIVGSWEGADDVP